MTSLSAWGLFKVMRMFRKLTATLLIGFSFLGFAVSVRAAAISPIVGYIGTYSSNILRESENEQWEYINRPLLGLDLDQRGRSINAYGYVTAEYFDFTQGTAEDETYFDANAIAEWNIVGDRFTWVAEDYASVTPVVVSDPLTPLNVEQRNIFVTGPTLTARIGARNLFDWSLRYGSFYYQKSNIDNQRYYSDLGISRQINQSNSVRLGYEITRTTFREEFYEDYIRQDAVLSYDYISRTGNITTTAGYTYLDSEDSEEATDGWLMSVVGSKRIGRRTLLNLVASSALTDTGLSNLSGGVSEIIPEVTVSPNQAFSVPSQAATPEIYRESILSFGLVNNNPVLISSFNIGYVQADYIGEDFSDNDRVGADLNFEHPIRADSLLGVFMGVGRQEYPNQGDDGYIDDDWRMGSNITWRLFRRINLVFELTREGRRSNEPGRGYTETMAEVQLIYRPSGIRSVARSVRGR